MDDTTTPQSSNNKTKTCPHCQQSIPPKAKRCPYCQSDLRKWTQRHPVLFGVAIIILIIVVLNAIGHSSVTTNNTTSSPSQTTSTSVAAPIWHKAYTYSNNTGVQTPSFNLQGTTWRITYTCTPAADTSSDLSWVTGEIDKASDGSEANLFANTVACPASQTSYAYGESAGQYFLGMESINASYTVEVDDSY